MRNDFPLNVSYDIRRLRRRQNEKKSFSFFMSSTRCHTGLKGLNVEWPSLHESILQKRRNEIKKQRSCNNNINSAQSDSKETQEEFFYEKDTSDTF